MLTTKNYNNTSSVYANLGKFNYLEVDNAIINDLTVSGYYNKIQSDNNYYNKLYIHSTYYTINNIDQQIQNIYVNTYNSYYTKSYIDK